MLMQWLPEQLVTGQRLWRWLFNYHLADKYGETDQCTSLRIHLSITTIFDFPGGLLLWFALGDQPQIQEHP